MNDRVCIKSYNNRAEAEVARALLEANGIKAVVTADDEGGMAPYPFAPSSSGVKLLVSNQDLKKAQEILTDLTHVILKKKYEGKP